MQKREVESKHYDIITVGSATVDVFVKTKADLIKIQHPAKPEEELLVYPLGSKILVESLSFETGGGGTNSAVSFSRLGCNSAYLGKVADDINGNKVLRVLQKENVDFIGSVAKKGKGQTGFSVVLDSFREDRTILAFKGVNDDLKFSEVNKHLLNTHWFYFSSMVNGSYKTLEKIAFFAKKKHMKIAFNPSSYIAKLGTKFLGKLLKHVNVLILNREEASYVVGAYEIEHMLRLLRRLGPSVVVITDGKNGAYCFDGHCFYSAKPLKVKVVETTGAGDAFASAFVAGIIKGNDISHSIKMGISNSASVISGHGAKKKLLHWKDMQKFVKKVKVVKHA